MSSRLGFAMAVCTALFGCDPNVVVGYGEKKQSHDASIETDAGDDAAGAIDAQVATDAATDAGIDASTPQDAGPPASVTWSTGAHAGNDLQEYLDFGTWRGRALDLAALYPDRSSWVGIVNPSWPVDMFGTFKGKLLLNLPLYPEGIGNNQDCAAGNYDSEWQKLGTFLMQANREEAIVRLGWGFNDSDHPWTTDADPSQWIACFRNVVTAIRSTAPTVLIDWSFNPPGAPEVTSIDPYAAYPGDDYVDFVGIEAFDMYPPTHDQATWDRKCTAPGGLCSVIGFARAHGKKVGIAEWGVTACSGDPGNDNPFYVRKMFDTFAENDDVLAYESYFVDGDLDVCSDLGDTAKFPLSSASYKALYGPR